MLEDFRVISGDISAEIKVDTDVIEAIAKERYKHHVSKAHHEWINEIDDLQLKSAIDNIRSQRAIFIRMQEEFPGMTIRSVKEVDEIYWAVSPDAAKASDTALVDCHYDAPFGWIPTFGVTFYRIIIGMNENNTVTTYFPDEDKKVKMTTGEFHGLDFNQDWHCIDGTIPKGKHRILLKLHYIVIPKNRRTYAKFISYLNTCWAKFSRSSMNLSSDPRNPFYNRLMSFMFRGERFLILNILKWLILILILVGLIYYLLGFALRLNPTVYKKQLAKLFAKIR